jgi:RND family efflux transporter MFP subunit
MMKKATPLLTIVGLFLVSMLWTACGSRKSQDKPAAESLNVIPVQAVSVVRQKVSERLTYTGTLEAWRKINITPETGGKVAKIHVEEGQRVEKDQLLAELDTESLSFQLKQAEAALAVADANLKNATRNKERMDRLFTEKAVSDAQVEQVKLGYEAAKAQFEQAQAAVNLVRHALDVSIMKAPWNGIVASKNAEVGDVINPMMGSFSPLSGVLTLVDYSRIKITVEVSQSDVVRIRKGQPAVVRISGAETKDIPGTVAVVNSTADPLARKFRVEVLADNPDLVLRPGTFGSVLFEVQSRDNALVVPQKAILDNTHVFVVENGRAARRDVTLGLRNTLVVEVVAGLKEGERVIVEGNYGLIAGTPVEVKR